MMGRIFHRTSILLAVAVAASSAHGSTIRDDVSDSEYLDLATHYPSVGLVRTAAWRGSGTLIGSDWVVTAAHVLDGASNVTFELNGQSFSATQTIIYDKWDGDLGKGYDIGLIEFNGDIAAATGITPASLYRGSDELGQIATSVGYGITGTGLTGASGNASTLRAVQNMIDVFWRTPGKTPRTFGMDFDNPHDPTDSAWGADSPLQLEGLVAPGDSGGGAFINVGGEDLLAGVTSFGAAYDGVIDSDYGDVSGHTRVSQFAAWIDGIIGGQGSSGGGGGKKGKGGGRPFNAYTVPEPGSVCFIGLAVFAAVPRRRATRSAR